MKYKIAICKISMLSEPVLILGYCRYDDDDAFWQKLQLFTGENYLSSEDMAMRRFAEKRCKYHDKQVTFSSVNKTVNILEENHDFHVDKAEPVELVKGEWDILSKELIKDGWKEFDSETWGK